MSGLVDTARDMSPLAVGALAALCVVLGAFATIVQLSVRGRKAMLRNIAHEIADDRTGLLPQSAISVQLGADLRWGASAGTPVSVVAVRLRGAKFVLAAQALRDVMRAGEHAFLVRDDRVVVELWNAGPPEAALGARRIGSALAAAGFDVVDMGIACSPRDGEDPNELVSVAMGRLRPVDDQLPSTYDGSPAPGPFARNLSVLVAVLPWFAAMGLLLLSCWRLLPAILEPRLQTLSGVETALPLIGIATIAGAAALLWATCWNLGGGTLPRSRPVARATWRAIAVVASCTCALLAFGALEPHLFGGPPSTLGVALAVVLLVILTIAQARQLVHASAAMLVALVAVGGVLVYGAVEAVDLPVVANAARLLTAAGLGALLARAIERPSWLVGLSVLVAGVDIWSVFSSSGVSHQLLESDGASASQTRDLLLFVGPHVHGAPLLLLGTTDLVFLALYLAWAHDWRMDVRIVTAALVLGAFSAIVASAVLDATGHESTVPVLPALALGMVLLVSARWLRLRRRRRVR